MTPAPVEAVPGRSAGDVTKSLRLLDAEWAALDRLAKKRQTPVHALLREAVADALRKAM